MDKQKIIQALEELRKVEKRKFTQSVDIMINLKSFDMKWDSVNIFLTLPHKIRDAKVCAFLTKKSKIVDSVVKEEFDRYEDKKKVKKFVKDYDFFISAPSLMPQVAKTFGRYLGTAGKMPSPQLGVIKAETDEEIQKMATVFNNVVRVKSKEPSLKFSIGKESMKDEDLADNILKSYETILNILPKKKENLRSVMIKFTMTKPIKIE